MFVCRDSNGQSVVAGSWLKDGGGAQDWKGPKPSDLLVIALCSCSAYDVVHILQKQRQNLKGLSITADASQAQEPPYQFTEIHLHYVIFGQGISDQKAEKAIALSQEKYCSVAATIRGVTKITYTFEVKGE